MSTRAGNRFVEVLIVACTLVVLAGCNTIEGAGKDIERAGEEIQEEAEEAN